jgi:predicted GIY-YIG superfamily endonuclease
VKYVYLIQLENTDIYKIGYTKNAPKIRLKSLQTASPYKLVLVEEFLSKWATKLEGTLHRTLRSYKIDENEYKLQGEFFKLDHKTRSSFIEMCEKIEHNFDTISKHSTLKKPF